MTGDNFIGEFVKRVRNEISKRKDGLASTDLRDMYHVGRLQGGIDGLESALQILDQTYEEQDN